MEYGIYNTYRIKMCKKCAGKRGKKEQKQIKENKQQDKDLNSIIIIMWNVNGLNVPIKKQTWLTRI